MRDISNNFKKILKDKSQSSIRLKKLLSQSPTISKKSKRKSKKSARMRRSRLKKKRKNRKLNKREVVTIVSNNSKKYKNQYFPPNINDTINSLPSLN